jgi:hypothetical protein
VVTKPIGRLKASCAASSFDNSGFAGAMIQQREVRANMGLRELEFPFFFTFFL